tara:strand:+ start:9114 stop:9461 length:348 start_codon:yes stop_codon:yes gene_type:complete
MKKRIKQRRFSRKEGPRKGLLKTMARSVVLEGKIQTTQAKAKEISSLVEKFITKAKKGDLASRRQLAAFLGQESAKKLIEEIAPRYKDRAGGYTRVFRLPARKSDAAQMAIIELV